MNFLKKAVFSVLTRPVVARWLSRILLKIDQKVYSYLGLFATASEQGLHPKHRLMNYHKFFVDNVAEGETVLDVGCSNGAVLKDVAEKTKALAVGVEISEENVKNARKRLLDLTNVEIIHTDVWKYQVKRHFDTIILSNVLEHLDNRPELLSYLIKEFKPRQLLIRVPMFEREWLVPYKKELGIEWRLDSTHKIEYTEDEFRHELEIADLYIKKIIFRWGEIYAVTVPQIVL